MHNLANALQACFEQHGQSTDLDEAIEHLYAALELRPHGHPDRFGSLNNLADSLRTRFERLGQTTDIDEANNLHRVALEICPEGHPDHSKLLGNFATSLFSRFKKFGNIDNLEECVGLLEGATVHDFSGPVIRLQNRIISIPALAHIVILTLCQD